MATIICPCIGDTYIDNVNTTLNHGDVLSLPAGNYISQYFYSYFQFDVSQIAYSKINKMTLVLDGGPGFGDLYYMSFIPFIVNDIARVNDIEYSLTYNNRDSLVSSVGYSISYISPSVPGPVVRLDVTSAFNKTFSQNNVMGFTTQIGAGLFYFDSRETANGGYLEVETETLVGLPPTNLLPQTTQNPKGAITFSWWHTPPETISVDPQVGWELTAWQDGETPITITQNNPNNRYVLPANTFTLYKPVYYRVRTRTQNLGYGAFAQSQFTLAATPPLAPTLIYPPLDISIPGLNGVPLEWIYNSPYDTFPSQFDIRYKLDNGEWIYGHNYSYENHPAYQSFMTKPIITQEKVTWQVMAFGAFGDASPWSELGIFQTIGIPDTPVIVQVTNSNRPTIHFSATNAMSWELEILQNDFVIYRSENTFFSGEFRYQTNQFLDNGNYIVRMRITNEFGINSDWGQLPFTIDTVAPEPLKLQLVSNPGFNMRLHFANVSKSLVYIYRAELNQDNYLRIGKTTDSLFDDFTTRPETRYKYFVRVVNVEDSFADSNIVSGSLNFRQTTIAEYTSPQDMLMLMYAMDGQPQKDESYDFDTKLTNFVGREKPVFQMGEHSSLSQSYSFYCSLDDYAKLKKLRKTPNTLILRDWRLGVLYGKIMGAVSASRETNGSNVSFVFTETDFDEEVDLI